jgi:mono/diheme cytochrome c family protein
MGILPDFSRGRVWQCCELSLLVATIRASVRCPAPAMPAFGWQLSNEQIAAVATYVRNSWGHAAPVIASRDVGKARQDLEARAEPNAH